MKKFLNLCAVLAVLFCALSASATAQEEYTLLTATDLHYIAAGLTDHGAYFTALTESSDGKLMRCIE